jgi:hypothetical protein
LLDELYQAHSAVVKQTQCSLSLPPEGGGIIRSKIFRALRFGKSRLIKALVVMRLEIQERSELNFVSRIIQEPLAIGNYPRSAA